MWNFIVSGYIPGTDYQVSFYMWVIVICMLGALVLVSQLFSRPTREMIEIISATRDISLARMQEVRLQYSATVTSGRFRSGQ